MAVAIPGLRRVGGRGSVQQWRGALVGHQPVVEELVRALVGSTRPKLFGFRTATIVSLVPGEGPSRWTLEALHDPDRLPG